MPITACQLAHRDMRQMEAAGYRCGECGARLVTAFFDSQYVLRCTRDINHFTIVGPPKGCAALTKEESRLDSTILNTMDENTMMQRVGMARFPRDLTQQERLLIARVAISYGLDPLVGELTIYQGNPYVSIDGRRRKAQETGELDGISVRPATLEERESWGVGDDDKFFHADIFKKGCSHPFEGWGKVTKAEYDRNVSAAKSHNKDPWHLPIVRDPQGLAAKRAEAQGLRRGFHIPLPSAEDIGTDNTSEEYRQELGA